MLKQSGANPQMMGIFAAISASASWSPLPPPEQLRSYEEVLPGSADRILSMAERQANHRQDLERTTVEGGNRRSWWGLWIGGGIVLAVLALSGVLISEGHGLEGTVLGSVDLASLAGVFVYGRSQQRKERVQKNAQSQLPTPTSPT
jgi:uncharacterized membrane protein